MGLSKDFLKGLMDNPNFQKWFGESVVRDAEGLPLEVYHGTANSFDTFAPTGMGAGSRESGLGSWFTENLDVADNFANFARSSDRAKSGPAIIPGSLKMANPWKPESYDDIRDLVDKFTEFERPGYMFRDRNIRMSDDKVDHAAAVNHLKSQGYDGIMLEKTRVDSPDDGETLVNQYIAFDPTQFKSRFNAGTFDPTDPNFLKSLGLMTAGTGAAAYGMSPDDAEAMYIGPKGLANLLGPDTAKKLLTDAEQMAAKGVDNEAVRQATGLFQGMDGKWRYEVDDSGAGLMPDAIKGLRTKNGLPQSRVTSHNELFSAYPELADTWTVAGGPVGSGEYHSGIPGKSNMMVLGVGKRGAVNEPEIKNTLLHELQHAIQQREGFARGGSPSEFTQVDDAKLARDALAFRRELDKMPRGMDSLTKENAIVKDYQDMDAMDFLPSREARDLAHDRDYNPDDQLLALVKAYGLDKHADMTPKRAYDWLAGEIEARDTAARMNYTPEQRRATPPDLRDDAIVRFDGGQAASVAQPREWARDAGSNTPNVAQALTPNDPFSPSPSQLASAAALVAALKSKDAPLEDTYQPADFLTAFLTGGGGLASRSIQAALDPVFSAAMDYAPRVADAINPRNIILGLMR